MHTSRQVNKTDLHTIQKTSNKKVSHLKARLKWLAVLVLFAYTPVFAQLPIWTLGTARTLEHHYVEKGIFLPLRYGLKPTVELQTHPLAMLVHPNIRVKKNWGMIPWGIYVTSLHGFYYPTLSMRLASKQNLVPEILPQDSIIPHIFAFRNELILSKACVRATTCHPANHIVSLKIGAKVAPTIGESTMRIIDKPLLYQETSIYRDLNVLWYVGADWDGFINETLNFSLDLDFMAVDAFEDWAVAHKGMLIFYLSQKFYMVAGYKLLYGTYHSAPIPLNKFSVFPLFDIVWRHEIKPQKKEQKGLFGPSK